MTPEQHERIIAIQEELFTISESLTTGKDATALRKASEWLSDVTEPLTETEADDWPLQVRRIPLRPPDGPRLHHERQR